MTRAEDFMQAPSDPVRILMISRCELTDRLGAAQVLLRLAEQYRALGEEVDLVGPDELGWTPRDSLEVRAEKTRDYIVDHGSDYDVVDYDHEYLPYARSTFPADLLLAARAQLLAHHVASTRFPLPKNWLSRARRYVGERRHRPTLMRHARSAQTTVENADIVLLLNRQEKETLAAAGVSEDKLHVVPNGIVGARAGEEWKPACTKRLVFIGTFTPRKGSIDLPQIFRSVSEEHPDAVLRLLGVSAPQRAVRDAFAAQDRARVEITPRFERGDLPALLEDCALGVFPSYMEGFPLAVLEMVSHGIPVVAYDAPGPPEIVEGEWLVPVGDADAFADRVAHLLGDPAHIERESERLRSLVLHYTWPQVAGRYLDLYRAGIQAKRDARLLEA